MQGGIKLASSFEKIDEESASKSGRKISGAMSSMSTATAMLLALTGKGSSVTPFLLGGATVANYLHFLFTQSEKIEELEEEGKYYENNVLDK